MAVGSGEKVRAALALARLAALGAEGEVNGCGEGEPEGV